MVRRERLAHVARIATMLSVLGGSGMPAEAQTLTLTFSGDPGFGSAIDEYRTLWSAEGGRITSVLERVSGLTFAVDQVDVEVMEGPSWAGGDRMGMRASYPTDTKRATLAHELGHILMGDLLPEGEPQGSVPDAHYVLFLFLYDAWVELWGRDFAEQEVAVESARRGLVDYEGIWEAVLRHDAEARAAELREIVGRYGAR